MYCQMAAEQLAYNITFYVGLATKLSLSVKYYEDITLQGNVDNCRTA